MQNTGIATGEMPLHWYTSCALYSALLAEARLVQHAALYVPRHMQLPVRH